MAAVLRTAGRLAGVAARATIRAVEHYARRRALQHVTRGITVADILRYATMTWSRRRRWAWPPAAKMPGG